MKKPLRHYALVTILALAIAPYFIRLGASSLWDSNEAFYAETPREMIESGDYINPSFNYQPRFNKPPLSYWVVAAFYNLLGVSESSERLAIAFGAMAMIAAAFALGRALYGAQAGLLAAIGLAIAPRFLMFSRRIMIDVYVAMFMSLALLFFALAETNPRRRRLYLSLMYAAVGLGVMTKGPVAAVLPALAFIIYLVAYRRLNKLREMMLPTGTLIVAAIVIPWYAAVFAQHGWSYIEAFVFKDNLSRFAEPVWGPRRSFLFYLPVMIGDMFPWSVFILTAAWLALKEKLRRTNPKLGNDSHNESRNEIDVNARARGRALLAIWIVVIVVFFSLSSSKEDLYILPVYPAAAAIVGGLLARFINNQPKDSSVKFTVAALALILLAAGAGAFYLFGGASSNYGLAGTTAIAAAAIIAGFIALIALFTRRRFAAVIATAAGVIAANWVFVTWTLPDFERYKPVRAFSEVISASASNDAMIGYYRLASPSLVYYLRRPVFEYYQPDELFSALSSGKEVYCLMTMQDYEAIKDGLPVPTSVLASRPIFQVKLKGILDRAELPQVVLISNKGGAETAQ